MRHFKSQLSLQKSRRDSIYSSKNLSHFWCDYLLKVFYEHKIYNFLVETINPKSSIVKMRSPIRFIVITVKIIDFSVTILRLWHQYNR